MKTGLLSSVRVEQESIAKVESLLDNGESIAGFVEAAVRTAVLRKRNQAAFIARGLRSLEDARRSGDYGESDEGVRKLQSKLDAARAHVSGLTR